MNDIKTTLTDVRLNNFRSFGSLIEIRSEDAYVKICSLGKKKKFIFELERTWATLVSARGLPNS